MVEQNKLFLQDIINFTCFAILNIIPYALKSNAEFALNLNSAKL